MAEEWAHGKETNITVASHNISPFTNQSEMTRGAAGHNVTAYGKSDEAWSGGIRSGKFTCSGLYDKTETTGTAVLDPLVGQVVPIVRRPAGVGDGLPMQSFNGLMVSYVETAPVSDIVTWSAEFTVSGGVVRTVQEV